MTHFFNRTHRRFSMWTKHRLQWQSKHSLLKIQKQKYSSVITEMTFLQQITLCFKIHSKISLISFQKEMNAARPQLRRLKGSKLKCQIKKHTRLFWERQSIMGLLSWKLSNIRLVGSMRPAIISMNEHLMSLRLSSKPSASGGRAATSPKFPIRN